MWRMYGRWGFRIFVLLPGTKNTMDDLLWLRQSGMEAALLRLHGAGVPILGVCGGYQMLGETVDDPEGTESGRSRSLRGLGLLPVRTVFTGEKTRTRPAAVALAEPFAGARLEGYEIHMGRTESRGAPFCTLEDGRKDGCCRGLVWGTYLHGLFDTGALTERLVQFLCARRGIRRPAARLSAIGLMRSVSLMLWPTAYVLRWTWMQFIKAWGVMQTMERNTELGLVHLYWGAEAKGKTTAALGLALRALGAGHSVAVVQFLKEGNSGEVALLRQLGAHIFRGKGCQKFVRQMSAAEREHAAELQTAHLRMALALEPQVLILDRPVPFGSRIWWIGRCCTRRCWSGLPGERLCSLAACRRTGCACAPITKQVPLLQAPL